MVSYFNECWKCSTMDSKSFKRKKFSPSNIYSKFPYRKNKPYIGIFDGHSVSVLEKDAICDIYLKGNFGKGSLSRSAPACIDNTPEDDIPPVILKQQWQNQLKWRPDIECQNISNQSRSYESNVYAKSVQDFLNFAMSDCDRGSWQEYKANQNEYGSEKAIKKLKPCSVAVCSQTESENDIKNDPLINMVEEILKTGKIKEPKSKGGNQYVLVAENMGDNEELEDFDISNVKVTLKNNFRYREECLKLNLCEAFFLHYAIGCLKITNSDGLEMNLNDLWKKFCEMDKNFIDKYIFYHHYRAFGWTVRSGLKFGGDYLLYKIGPMYYHGSYLIWILNRKKKNKMTWNEFLVLNRLVETCNKDLLLCEVLGPDIEEGTFPDVFKEFSLLEFASKRWIPSQEREQKHP